MCCRVHQRIAREPTSRCPAASRITTAGQRMPLLATGHAQVLLGDASPIRCAARLYDAGSGLREAATGVCGRTGAGSARSPGARWGESYECSSTRVVLDRLQLPRELDRVARAVAIAGGVEQATDRRPVCRVAAVCNGGEVVVAAGPRVVEIEAAVQLEVDHGDVM